MELAIDSGVHVRLSREDCEFVKHDKLFSKWKILVGPSDWRHRAAPNSGRNADIGRYHVQNLPAMEFGPGVFELGVTSPPGGSSWTSFVSPQSQSQSKRSQQSRPLKKEDVVPVYLGQAANMRARLQKFGQPAARLEPGSRSARLYVEEVLETSCGSMGPCLFSEVFAIGSCIAFRWAHTDSMVVAEQVVSELLLVFDYAWNRDIARNRRSRDVLAKLFMAWPSAQAGSVSAIPRSLSLSERRPPRRSFLTRSSPAVGIKVALRKPHDRETTTATTVRHETVATLNLCFPMAVPSMLKGRSAPSTRRQQNVHVEGTGASAAPWHLGFLRRCSCLSSSEEEGGRTGDQGQCGGERRRPCSLSFNTWMKKEADAQRVHDNGDADRQPCTDDDAGDSKRSRPLSDPPQGAEILDLYSNTQSQCAAPFQASWTR